MAGVTAPPAPTASRRNRRLVAYGSLLAIILVSWFGFDIPGLAESRMIYFPSREEFATPPRHEDVYFKTEGGLQLHGWLTMPTGWKPGDPPVPALLHVHGNAGNVSYHDEFSTFLPPAGYAVLLFDYRNYGRSDQFKGRMHRTLLLADASAALDYLLSRPEIDRDRVGIYGVSVGGVFGEALASKRKEVRAVVSLAAFSSWSRIARDHMGFLGWLLARGGLDAEQSIAALGSRPILIVHGGADDIVPPDHALRLKAAADAAGVPAELLLIPGVGHNDLAIDDAATQARIVEFLSRSLGPR